MDKHGYISEDTGLTLNRILEALYEAQNLLRQELELVMLDGASPLEIQGLTTALCDTDKVITDLLDCNLPCA